MAHVLLIYLEPYRPRSFRPPEDGSARSQLDPRASTPRRSLPRLAQWQELSVGAQEGHRNRRIPEFRFRAQDSGASRNYGL